MGIRTQSEIDHEKYALKSLRGDFREVKWNGNVREALAAASS
jgi:hypothetical protein